MSETNSQDLKGFFSKAFAWLKKTFISIKTDGAKIAVVITQDLQDALSSGTADMIAKIIESVFPSVHNLPEVIVAELKVVVPKTLAVELAVSALPDNPTEQDIKDFEARILDAFNVHDDKSKLYTTLAADVYGILERHQGNSWTFAQRVKAVEEAYQDYIAAIQEG
jgi:hypothetical protein